jgi:hypothetical protein
MTVEALKGQIINRKARDSTDNRIVCGIDQSMKGFRGVGESFHSGAPIVGLLDTYSGTQNNMHTKLIVKNKDRADRITLLNQQYGMYSIYPKVKETEVLITCDSLSCLPKVTN